MHVHVYFIWLERFILFLKKKLWVVSCHLNFNDFRGVVIYLNYLAAEKGNVTCAYDHPGSPQA